jgi:PmbA protein
MSGQLEELAARIVRQALDKGVAEAECTISEGQEFSANIRMREIESLKEAGARGAGMRVLIGKRAGSAYTSDLSEEGIARMVGSALEIAEIAGEDPFAGLPEAEELGRIDGDLGLYCPDVEALEAASKVELAKRAEHAALAADPRISNSEGASFGSHAGRNAFANSRGFAASYRTSSCSLSVSPVARDGDSMERDYWFSAARSVAALEPAEQVGQIAARRALRRLGARKVPTQKVPVIFEPRTARSLLGNIFEAVHGQAIYRKASFLAGRLDEKVASQCVTVIDDATLPGLFGTSPFDDEGVLARRTAVIEKGVLRSYLLNTYAARKLGLKTTGNAARGLAGNAGIGHGNFFLEASAVSPEEMLNSVKDGFYVTELMGFGVNIVTGDYSRGAAGLWIRKGELAFPVSEVTIAGNLKQMLMDIETAGSDLEFRGSVAAPTVLIREMTVAGN